MTRKDFAKYLLCIALLSAIVFALFGALVQVENRGYTQHTIMMKGVRR